MSSTIRLTAAAIAASALIATPAHATTERAATSGSIVFVKGHNVWIARGDGTGAHQVTDDGTARAPGSRRRVHGAASCRGPGH